MTGPPPELLLALETSGSVGSVAVARKGEVLARTFLTDPRGQASGILPALERTLEEARLQRGDVQGVLVGSGPGSFTGVRIAAATAKGLAHALAVPVWAFSSLAAGAVSDLALPARSGPEGWEAGGASRERTLRYVLFDARGDRVYAALYRLVRGAPMEVEGPRATGIAELLSADLPPGVAFAGDGAVRHRERFVEAGFPVLGPPAGFPTADGLLHLLALSGDPDPLDDPGGWEPEYLRPSSAERGRGR